MNQLIFRFGFGAARSCGRDHFSSCKEHQLLSKHPPSIHTATRRMQLLFYIYLNVCQSSKERLKLRMRKIELTLNDFLRMFKQ